jgi:hypothetical protein
MEWFTLRVEILGTRLDKNASKWIACTKIVQAYPVRRTIARDSLDIMIGMYDTRAT